MTRAIKSELTACPWRRRTASAALATFALLLAGSVQLCLARPLSRTTFPSPEEASRALFAAVQRHDERAVTEILGAGTELVGSHDRVQDTLDRERFVQKYQEMHRLVQEPRGVTSLYIGAENWPFPIPLVSRNGAWRFDSDDGANEILFRRIGENEVTTIGICHALVARKTNVGVNRSVPFHGYYFRFLSKSGGGFAAIAYPALYRSSGVMTFIVNQDDVVYEKDLGPNTAKAASAMTTAHLDATWTPAESMP